MRIDWQKSSGAEIADYGKSRLHVKRKFKGARTFVAKLNGKYLGEALGVDAAKAIAVQAARKKEGALRSIST